MSSEHFMGSGSYSKLLHFVDGNETYGAHVIKKYLGQLSLVAQAVDLGAGTGRDLGFVRDRFPGACLYAIDCRQDNATYLKNKGIKTYVTNIENEVLSFSDESLDLVICNHRSRVSAPSAKTPLRP